jgi:hypothetical protein
MATLKLGLTKMNASELLAFSDRVVTEMTSNAHFPNPSPSLADISAKRAELESETIQSISGDRHAILRRNMKSDELKQLLRALSGYITMIAQGNGSIIVSSGFEIRRKSNPTGPLARPVNLKARRSDHTGRVKLQWTPVKNAINCQIEMTTTDPTEEKTEWATAGITSKSKIIIGNLVPGNYYWFRVKAFGRRHESGYSQPTIIMAA